MRRLSLVLGAVAIASATAGASPPDGPALYGRLCLPCHGAAGDGRGPAAPWLDPAPRDLTAGVFKWTTTGDPEAPARDDLRATIRWGVPGAMPAFGATLDAAAEDAVIDVVLGLAGLPRDPAPAGPRPTARGGDPTRGAELYRGAGCAGCHGPDGKGDGTPRPNRFGPPAPARDLVAVGARRPGPDRATAIAADLRYGVGGTAMPAFALDAAEAADLAAYVASLATAPPPALAPLTPAAIDADRAARTTAAGYRVGAPGDPDGDPWGHAIAPQGPPPPRLAPAQAALSSRQCGRCHAKQVREWTGTIHGAAGSPGLFAQTTRMRDPADVASCLRCHAPLAEQQPRLPDGTGWVANPGYDAALASEGLTCAACHLRGWERLGPPGRAPSLLPLPGYPVRELAVYERADLCIGCHQLPPRLALDGRPLLDTYREWLFGPYMPRGIQCQHCHMPNREHTWKGVHDPETFRQGIAVVAVAGRTAAGVTARARVTNVGAGHMLPTTPTPAAWLVIDLVDAAGAPITGAHAELRIGRAIAYVGGRFVEREDTRIAPGASRELAGAWRGPAVAGAVAARVTVRVKPDDYYEGLYRSRLAGTLDAPTRALYQAALDRTLASPYVAYQAEVPIAAVAPAR